MRANVASLFVHVFNFMLLAEWTHNCGFWWLLAKSSSLPEMLLRLLLISATALLASSLTSQVYHEVTLRTLLPQPTFSVDSHVDCIATCAQTSLATVLFTSSKLPFCWKAAFYRSEDRRCYCHNDTTEVSHTASSPLSTMVVKCCCCDFRSWVRFSVTGCVHFRSRLICRQCVGYLFNAECLMECRSTGLGGITSRVSVIRTRTFG